MSDQTAPGAIAFLYHFSIQGFKRISNTLGSLDLDRVVYNDAYNSIQDELGRFKVWAEDMGAHRTGRMSLDDKLREASHIQKPVAGLLRELVGCLYDRM